MTLVGPFRLETFCDSVMCHNMHTHTQTHMYHKTHMWCALMYTSNVSCHSDSCFRWHDWAALLGADLVLLVGQTPSTTSRLLPHSPLPDGKRGTEKAGEICLILFTPEIWSRYKTAPSVFTWTDLLPFLHLQVWVINSQGIGLISFKLNLLKTHWELQWVNHAN